MGPVRWIGYLAGLPRRLALSLNAMALTGRRKVLLLVLAILGLGFGGYCVWLVLGIFR